MGKLIAGIVILVVVAIGYKFATWSPKKLPPSEQPKAAAAAPKKAPAEPAMRTTKGGMSIWSHQASDNPSIPRDARVIPSAVGRWDVMWAPLREIEALIAPIEFGPSMESLDSALASKGYGNVAGSDLKPVFLYQQMQDNQGRARKVQVVYTDARLITGNAQTLQQPPADQLKALLMDPQAEGTAFNPRSSVSSHTGFSYTVDKFYLARIIGFLQAGAEVDPGKAWQRAIDARKRGEAFQAIYWAGRSYDEKEDDWPKSIVPKLWGWHTTNFPDARKRTQHELQWFIGKFGANDETRALQAVIDATQ